MRRVESLRRVERDSKDIVESGASTSVERTGRGPREQSQSFLQK